MILVKAFIKLLLLIITFAFLHLPGIVLIHEATHYIPYSCEKITLTTFHMLDVDSFQKGRYGYIKTNHESKYGHVP